MQGRAFFVGLGAQKAGTTWVAQYLRGHPQVFIPVYKELHYFNIDSGDGKPHTQNIRFLKKFDELTAKHKLDPLKPESAAYYDRLETLIDRLRLIGEPERYRDLFEKRLKPEHRAFGEVTPSYAILDEACFRRMRAVHQPIRAVFLMRDPVTRIWSNMWFKHFKNPSYDPLTRWREALADPGVVARTRYDLSVRRMEAAFEPEELLFGFYETLFSEESVRRLCAFLGVDYTPADLSANPNPTRAGKVEKPPEFVAAARETFAPVYAFVRERFGAAAPWA